MSDTGSGPRSLWLRKVVTRPLVFEGLEVDLALRVSSAQEVCPARKRCAVSETQATEVVENEALRARNS